MRTSWLNILRTKRVSLAQLQAILLIIFTFFLLFFDYFYFADRPLPKVYIPDFNSTSPVPTFLAEINNFRGVNLKNPIAVAVGRDGHLYVVDSGNARVLIFNHEGKPLLQFGKFGTLDGELNYPYAIAVDQNNLIYVGQFKNPRIQVFDAKGNFLRLIDNSSVGLTVIPLAMATDAQGNLFVANQDGKVLVLDSQGKLIRAFAGAGSSKGNLSYPKGIAVDDQKIYVSDTNNMRVQVFTKEGQMLQEVAVGMPTGIDCDSGGNVFVVDTFSNRVKIYDSNLKLVKTFGVRGIGDGELNFPVGIAVDQFGKVYIADTANNRVVVFQR